MKTRPFAVLLLALPLPLAAAEETPKSSAREALRARLVEDARKSEATKSTAPAPAAAPSASDPKSAPAAKSSPPAATNATAAKEQPTVLPKVEVRKERITELDVQIAKQEQDIARERRNTKSSELDSALNDAKIARPLAIFGGDSTQFRKGVANERVSLMEAEKDILEAMKTARTKEEKAALQKQLDEIRAMRRELDKTMR